MNIKRRLTAIGLIFSLMVLIFGGGQNLTAVYATDTISHTHIWATKYDKTNHWEYCTVCGEKRNVTAHTFTDHWRLGYESCDSSNWSNRSCICGYSYTYRKPHGTLEGEGPYSTVDNPWKNLGIRGHHFWRCPECRNWLKTETCKNSNGKVLNCTNPGTCATCGVVYTKDNHILKDGKCINCGIQFVTYSAPTYDYAADGTSVTVKFKIPQILIANHAGTSQFRVKCDDLKAGNIKITVPNSFPYKQTGKVDVTATITSKSGNNIITPSNKVCVYNITTTNGLSAGCWSGSFNIGLTLTKE